MNETELRERVRAALRYGYLRRTLPTRAPKRPG
jgi:hypothetical protein